MDILRALDDHGGPVQHSQDHEIPLRVWDGGVISMRAPVPMTSLRYGSLYNNHPLNQFSTLDLCSMQYGDLVLVDYGEKRSPVSTVINEMEERHGPRHTYRRRR